MQVTELFDKPLSLVSAPRRIAAPANGAAASAVPAAILCRARMDAPGAHEEPGGADRAARTPGKDGQ